MISLYSNFGLLSGLLFTCLITISFGSSDKDPTVSGVEEVFTHLPQQVHSIDINKSYDLAGELVPMNMDTRERLDRELSVNAYWHSSTLLNIKMAAKYFPTIERILAEEGVPDDFKYLAVAESNLRNVSSGAEAKGFWQFRKKTGKEWNLEINNEIDERYHLEKSTQAACKYLKHMKKKFGTWSNAAAAYNVGHTSFNKQRQAQGEDSFYNMNINAETSRYLFRIIAIKEIITNPQVYGFYLDSMDKYDLQDQVEHIGVSSSIPNLSVWAHDRGISYRTLKYFNPWLIAGELTVKRNTYKIAIQHNKTSY